MTVQHGVLPDVDDPVFAPFWQGTRQGRLLVPRCDGCTRSVWPPRPVCPRCHGAAFTWTPVAPTGALFTWTVAGHPTVDTMDPGYVVAIVELDSADSFEGTDGAHGTVRMLGNVWGADPAALRVGQRMSARFDRVSEGCTLVNWVLDDPAPDA